MSFFHDINGLLKSNNKITIVVINNGGGGIFSFLPIAKLGLKDFGTFWTANTNLNIKNVSKLYKCKYFIVDDKKKLNETIIKSFQLDGIKIIEVKIDIKSNVLHHLKLYKKIKQRLL